MISKKKTLGVWLVWLMVWPLTLVMTYTILDPTLSGRGFDLFSFGILMCIVALFPIIVNGIPIFFIHGISLAVFLYFGLFFEIMLTQISVLILMGKMRVRKADSYRIPLNLLMFLTVSFISAGVYYALGGSHGKLSLNTFQDLLPIIAYAITFLISNQFIIHNVRKRFFHYQETFFNRSLVWEMMTSLFVIPVGFILYMLYGQIGAVAIYYLGIPFVGLSVILMLYYSSKRVNYYLQKTGDIGHELTGKLGVDEVLDVFVQRITSLLEVDYAYVYDVVENQNQLNLIRFFDSEQSLVFRSLQLQPFEGISGKVWGNAQGVHYQRRSHWGHIKAKHLPEKVESVISLPIKRNREVVGIITLTSKRKRAYEKYEYMIVDILTNYLAVAIENARNYEETKKQSERCPLTKLYNYRFFENKLQDYFQDMEEKEAQEDVSLILLDLDHFKSVNDTYGHQSGNEILCEVAERLTTVIGNTGTVARYGGEEFVILVPGIARQHCVHIAESIRRKIGNEPFIVEDHILNNKESIEFYVTASLGVATYPDDCEYPMELIRHADRAMYLGAKRKGRNRVASYEKVTEAAE